MSKPVSKAVSKAVSKPTSKPTGAARAAVKKTGTTAKKPAAGNTRTKQLGEKGFVPLPPRVSTTCERYSDGHNIHFMAVLGGMRHSERKNCRVISVDDDGTVVLKVGRQTLTHWLHNPDEFRNCIGPNGDGVSCYGSSLLMGHAPDGRGRAFNLGTVPSECTYIERPTFNEEYYGIRREDDPAEDDPDN